MTYEYACGACGYEWEAEQSISEKALTDCPKCEAKQAKRLVSGGTGFLLKGGGWYADGYGSSKSSGSSAASTETSSGTSSSDTTKSDSKTESKPKSDVKTAAA